MQVLGLVLSSTPWPIALLCPCPIFETGPHYVAQAAAIKQLCLHFLNAEITGVCYLLHVKP